MVSVVMRSLVVMVGTDVVDSSIVLLSLTFLKIQNNFKLGRKSKDT